MITDVFERIIQAIKYYEVNGYKFLNLRWRQKDSFKPFESVEDAFADALVNGPLIYPRSIGLVPVVTSEGKCYYDLGLADLNSGGITRMVKCADRFINRYIYTCVEYCDENGGAILSDAEKHEYMGHYATRQAENGRYSWISGTALPRFLTEVETPIQEIN